jgi:hypothetical protein
MLDLDTTFLQKLAQPQIDDLFLLATLEGEGLPTQHLSLGLRSLDWGATTGLITSAGALAADRQTYEATDGAFDTKRDTLDSEPPRSSISFTNLDGAWYDAIHESAQDYNGALITFKMVFASVDPTDIATSLKSRIQDGPHMLSGGQMGDDGVSFDFGTSFNALKLRVPALLSRARRCQFAYKGPYCRATSSLTSCDKSPHACSQRHGAVLRFSAWPFSNKRFF